MAIVGVAGVFAAEPLTGQAGATVGAVVGALLLLALAAAVWPWEWTKAESTHRELESIWHELRTDAAQRVEWDRYAAWADAKAEQRGAQPGALRARTPATRRRPQPLQPRPPPADRRRGHRRRRPPPWKRCEPRPPTSNLTPSAATTSGRSTPSDNEHQSRLDAIERDAEAAIQAGEQQARRELAAQEAAERRAQADAVARALRRS